MCTVSMIGDDWARRIPGQYPWAVPSQPPITYPSPQQISYPAVSRAEFEALRKEVEALRELLKAAKEYDAATGQPDCEVEPKVALIREIAKLGGVDLSDVFPTGDEAA